MMVMAVLVHLPVRIVAALAITVIALHNTLDGVQAAQFGEMKARRTGWWVSYV